ncbi:efflux MFS transporter permease [Solitalea koreensis]|uniref:MFS transporter, DHA2 family, multidrug resistance protein n=1 Tax=Solitalea koreensis TaxID=543615 RepID=A0A521C2L0_9SPHI|nr:MFS transporter [Solitalea koreensis]SMO53639.1 MFS transporter, DHA2 family, multidrug resistance protein [Solitalea koreensis]
MRWKKGELLKVTGLYLLIVPFLNVLNATGYVSSQLQGHFGASSVEFMYMSLVPVFSLVAGLPLAIELAKIFPLKSMMLSIIIISIILNTCSAYAPDILWFTICRSLLAFFTIFGIVAAIIPIVFSYNPTLNMAIMYGIVQFIIQGSSNLYKFFGAQFSTIYDWRTSLLLLNINFFLCILLTFVFIRKDVVLGKQPFRFDFKGWLILILFLIPLLYLAAEGQNREWFSDSKIAFGVALFLTVTGGYILYAQHSANPVFNLKVFKHKNVVLGSLFFFLIGLANGTGSVIMGYMAGLLGFNELYIARTHLYIFVGLVISVPVCTYMMYHKIYLSVAAILGFLAFSLYHLLMFFRFYPGIGEQDFVLPFILKGIGIGFLYVLSALYISENVPKPLSTSRMMSGVLARIVFATLIGGSVLSTFISNTIIHHKTGISQQLTPLNEVAAQKHQNTKNYYLSKGLKPAAADKMADNPLQSEMAEPATLLTYKDIYLVMAGLNFIPILLVLFLGIGRRPLARIDVEPIPI